MKPKPPIDPRPVDSPGVDLVRAMRRVREELGQDHRYGHTLRVARLAARLAGVHGIDRDKARLAGLYHDLARLYSNERLLGECAARGMAIDSFELANPIVLHARLGAELARQFYGIDDEAILDAIRKHTVAAARMSRLDVILYLADGLEPGRCFAERAQLAELARHDLDAAMRAVLASTIAYLTGRRLEIAPQTQAAAITFELAPASVSGHHLETLQPAANAAPASLGPHQNRKASHCQIS